MSAKATEYDVYIVTGDKLGSGTKAEVKINIFGEHGSTGDVALTKSVTNVIPFQRSQVDVFHVQSDNALGKLIKTKIGHNGTALGMGWFLDKVVVKEKTDANVAFEFVCGRWLSCKEDDGLIVRELFLSKDVHADQVPKSRKSSSEPLSYRRISLSGNSQANSGRRVSASTKTSMKTPDNLPVFSTGKDKEIDNVKNSNQQNGTPHSYSSEQMTENKPISSIKKSPRARVMSRKSVVGSTGSSSDSESERKKRDLEKQKRRDRKQRKDSGGEETQGKSESDEFKMKIRRGPTIHQACEEGDFKRVKELVGDIPELVSKKDERGWAPLHITSAFGHLDLVKWLSVNGVDMRDVTPTGYTAIHLAAMNGHVNCIMILSAMGCPISFRTVDDFTPLHLASMSGHLECVKWLISNRARLDVKDSNGRSPLDLALEFEHSDCATLLRTMSEELLRKDSAFAMLRKKSSGESLSKRASKLSIVNEDGSPVAGKAGDSGVEGSNGEEEEWVSDAEDTSDVIGRGGDDRPETKRRISVQQGRLHSDAKQNKISVSTQRSTQGRISSRRISKQDERMMEEMEQKKLMYTAERRKTKSRKTSFLDSIRMDVDEDLDENEEEQPLWMKEQSQDPDLDESNET